MAERDNRRIPGAFPLDEDVVRTSRGFIRYKLRAFPATFNQHLAEVAERLIKNTSHEILLDEAYTSLPYGPLRTWHTVGVTMATDTLIEQFRRSGTPPMISTDVMVYETVRTRLIPEDWFKLDPDQIMELADQLRAMLNSTDDHLHLLADAMREYYVTASQRRTVARDMAYLSGIADVVLPFHNAHERKRYWDSL